MQESFIESTICKKNKIKQNKTKSNENNQMSMKQD